LVFEVFEQHTTDPRIVVHDENPDFAVRLQCN
jgi:hypothetical protein